MRIELLLGSLPVTEDLGFDSTDPRFDEIVTLAQAGKYIEAASLSEAILADGIYDIRLVCYFLYGYWLEQGLASLDQVINCLSNVLLENWELISPVGNKEKNVEKSLDWIFRQLLKKIQYEENKNTKLWRQWQADFSADEVNQILEAGEIFCLGISHRLEDKSGAVVGVWSKIDDWLRVFLQLMAPLPEEPVQIEVEEDEVFEDDFSEVDIPLETANRTMGLEIESSYHMDLLLKKLAAFERLLQEKKFPRAALVAVDINQTLCNFDPKLYFPQIFETFVRLQALNFEELAVYAQQQDDPQWQVMQDWLQTDVDSFMNY